VKGVPESKIHKFETGKRSPEYRIRLSLVTERGVQMRHNALEAARVSAHKSLSKVLGEEGFFLKVLIYPHHVLRENSLATGAGADRFQTGMAKAFGKPIGVAIRVKPGDKLASVFITRDQIPIAKRALRMGSIKLSGDYSLKIIDNPKKVY
jgi:large subunit ribosomal protein L10e